MSISFTAQWGAEGDPQFGEDINMANGNAAVVLDLLGYHEQTEPGVIVLGACVSLPAAFGETTPEDLLGRIAVARWGLDAATDDEHGKPSVSDGGPGTGRAMVIDCGRRPGYLAEKLDALEAVARDAEAHGGRVCWG